VREIITEITIAAPPEKVWEILLDFPSYGDWNPFVTAIDGESKVGEQLAASLRLPGGKTRGFKPKVTAVEPERLFQWFGKVGFDALFGGRHSFRLSPTEHGTRFEHSPRVDDVQHDGAPNRGRLPGHERRPQGSQRGLIALPRLSPFTPPSNQPSRIQEEIDGGAIDHVSVELSRLNSPTRIMLATGRRG